MIDLGPYIRDIACRLLGDPNRQQSTRAQLRFGNNGSIAVEISGPKRGEWFDHENQVGGGAREMLSIKGDLADEDIPAWLERELGIRTANGQDRSGGLNIVATYDYTDEHGKLLFQVCRLQPKDFRQRRPNGTGGWVWNTAGTPMVPYRLRELVAARAAANGSPWRCFICEGEKDTDRIRTDWNVTATTNPRGAGKWRPEFAKYFSGADVVILPHNDTAGRKHAEMIAADVAIVAAKVRVVHLGGLPEKGDISDWIDKGGWQTDLETLIEETEPFKPNASAKGTTQTSSVESNESWPEPADILGSCTMPAFPIDFLPAGFGDFVADQAHRIQIPTDFVAIPALIGAASVIGKDFRMAPKALDSWAERACLWGGIIGYVGDAKTPGFNAALAPIWSLQAEFRVKYKSALEAHAPKVRAAKIIRRQWEREAVQALKEGLEVPSEPDGIDPPESPTVQQIIANDTTQERLVDLMRQNPRGVLLYRDELSGWFGSFNQYRPGSDEQFYLQCHVGGPWEQQRKSGDVFIPDVFLNVCGGFQPDVVADVLRRARAGGNGKIIETGLAARFSLLVWPDSITHEWVDQPSNREQKAKIHRLFRDLLNFTPEGFVGPPIGGATYSPPFRFTPEGQEIFRAWYVDHHGALDRLEPGEPIKAHFAKYPGLFARLSLVRHLLLKALGEPVEAARVDERTATMVRGFIDDYLRPHAIRIYGYLDRDSAFQGARRIAKWIASETDITQFTARDVSRKQWSGLTGKDENTGKNQLSAALRYLEDVTGWLRSEERSTGPRGGRPTIHWIVNPRVRQLVEKQVENGFRQF